jgi:beta-alanine--pyruvate transaminase
MITFATGVTSGTVPMGGVIVRQPIYESFMDGPEHAVELLHGYSCSGHPLACAAGLAALDLYGKEYLFARALQLEPFWADAVHSLKGLPNVLDIRNAGLSAAIDLEARPGAPGKRGFDAMDRAFHTFDLLLRSAGDTLILTPPLIVGEAEIGEIVEKTARAINAVA